MFKRFTALVVAVTLMLGLGVAVTPDTFEEGSVAQAVTAPLAADTAEAALFVTSCTGYHALYWIGIKNTTTLKAYIGQGHYAWWLREYYWSNSKDKWIQTGKTKTRTTKGCNGNYIYA